MLADMIILDLKPPLHPWKAEIGQAYLEALVYVHSVYLRTGKVSGKYRHPGRFEHLAGDPRTEIVHKESGVQFKFNFHEIMWAKGNIHERRHLASLVQDGETVVDMFAGIGYFSLMIGALARPARVYAIEWNPTAFAYLEENVALNELSETLTPLLGDCRDIVPDLAGRGVRADRIIMGIIPAAKDAIDPALAVVSPLGTILHYEGLAERKDITPLESDITTRARARGYHVELRDHRFVKSYGPHVKHAVLDFFLRPPDRPPDRPPGSAGRSRGREVE